jgi:inosose dehydratase
MRKGGAAMKLGCHAVLFKELIRTNPDYVLKNYAAMGYRGVEIGSRFFGTKDRAFLEEKLNLYHIELSAMHVGSPLVDWLSRSDEIMQQIDAVADFVSDMPNKNILLSGNRQNFDPSADLKKIARKINEAAERCAAKGVVLNYHNHDLEFQDNGKIYHILAEFAPKLKFGLDLGWIYVGGMNPLQVLRELSDRVQYVHIRDTIGVGVRDFAQLGEGTLDLPKLLMEVNHTVGSNGWGIVEFDKGEPDMERCRQAKIYLDSLELGL